MKPTKPVAPGHSSLALYDDSEAEEVTTGSRSNKTRSAQRSVGLVRVEVRVPAKDVARIKALEAECAEPVLEAARARGVLPDTPKPLTDEAKKQIVEMVRSGKHTAAEVARQFRVHKSTVSRLLAQARAGV